MSWLLINQNGFFLMKGGNDKYIDKVDLEDININGTSLTSKISNFPNFWFDSIQAPRTIKIKRNETQVINVFSNLELLKILEIPVNRKVIFELKRQDGINNMLKRYFEIIGDYSLSTFYRYQNTHKVLPIKFSVNREIRTNKIKLDSSFFDNIDDNVNYDIANPKFSDIFLEAVYDAGITIRPYFTDYIENETIRPLLYFIKQPAPDLITRPVFTETLEKALLPVTYSLSSTTLSDILQYLLDTWKIAVNPTFDIWANPRPTPMTFSGKVSFTEVMDTIATIHSAFWDWQGSTVFLKKSN